jgi:RNA recognition motif-containing protein
MLYAGNLPISATEQTLVTKFAKFGDVLSVKLARDAITGMSRRSAFIEMRDAAAAAKAITGLHLGDFDGRVISVYKALAPCP